MPSQALIRRYGTGNTGLTALQTQTADLQSQLDNLKSEAEALRCDYQTKCSRSLETAINSLLKVCDTVCKSDKQIVFWYEKGKVLTLMLRPLGINKKTSRIVQKKTSRLKTQVSTVESKFSATSLLCKESLAEVQALNRRVNEFSQTSIGGAQNLLEVTLETFDDKKASVEYTIREKEIECRRISNNIDETNEGIVRVGEATGRVDAACDGAVAVSTNNI